MTKEDKQIIDRAVKEEWRIGDRTRLKRLLEKNLKLYRENVELERKLEQTEKDLADYQFNYPKIKELEKENAELDMKRKAERQIFQGIVEKKNEQLTKATKIIKNLLILKNDHYGNTKMEWRVEVTEQAEQLLKECK